MNLYNKLKNVFIGGNYIGRDQYNFFQNDKRIDFEKTVFLHYLGQKVATILFGNQNNTDALICTTKLIIVLFSEVLVSLSDITQTKSVFAEEFFRELIRYKHNNKHIISVTGSKVGKSLDEFLSEREKYYGAPGFYEIIPKAEFGAFLSDIQEASNPKRFSTLNTISTKWKRTFEHAEGISTGEYSAVHQSIINLINCNKDYFLSHDLKYFIDIPDRLDGYPFIWDSVRHLNLASTTFDRISISNIEEYLALEWVMCYLDNYDAYVPNYIYARGNCSMGLERTVDIHRIIRQLETYHILECLIRLNIEELVRLHFEYSTYLQDICQTGFFITGIQKVNMRIDKVVGSRTSNYKKIIDIIDILYSARKG